MKKPEIQECRFVAATDLVPKKWTGWFWEGFSSNAPFSWGDNNRSMITVARFVTHAQETFGEDDIKGFDKWVKETLMLGELLYVDLESNA